MKTSELQGDALDWAVAKCEGYTDLHKIAGRWPHEPQLAMMPPLREYGEVELWQLGYATDWSLSGPIIERAVVSLGVEDGGWRALCWGMDGPNRELYSMRGPTPLVAAMRCFVASRLGDTINIPEELQ
jgi:hypothetical protein